jgi:hypothetical protein
MPRVSAQVLAIRKKSKLGRSDTVLPLNIKTIKNDIDNDTRKNNAVNGTHIRRADEPVN